MPCRPLRANRAGGAGFALKPRRPNRASLPLGPRDACFTLRPSLSSFAFRPSGSYGASGSSLAFRPCIPGVALRPRWAACSRWSGDADFALGSCCASIAFRASGPRWADRANFALWSRRADIAL
jgi:hypothetical protein